VENMPPDSCVPSGRMAFGSGNQTLECLANFRLSLPGRKNGLVAGAGGVTVLAAMKILPGKAKISGLTLIELLVVIAVIAILAALLLPSINSRPRRAYRVMCMSNLKQIDLGFYMYAEDYGKTYPFQVPVEQGGTREFMFTSHVFPHFEKLHKYIPGQQFYNLLVCPSDKTRKAGTNAEAFTDLNISYLLNVDCSHTNNPSKSLLAGDRNLESNGQPVNPGLLNITTNINLTWSQEIHMKGGNLAFADGHVEWNKTDGFNAIIQQQTVPTNRICIP
jgi:prepilin-type N-terminal cleavage/methylation domain-containing protein/prepilin-type processing-associated H-X9-DG protein